MEGRLAEADGGVRTSEKDYGFAEMLGVGASRVKPAEANKKKQKEQAGRHKAYC
jgi:hypothetical protein